MMSQSNAEVLPPPLNLIGSGYVLIYRFPHEFAAQYTHFGHYQGGPSAVMLVDYEASDIGPYHELLFIPGIVELPGLTGFSISRIYVDTMASLVNGQANWGIPKELAAFEVRPIDAHTEQIRVTSGERRLLEITLNSGGIRFPVNAFLLPPIVQHWEGRTFITKIQASGGAQFADVVNIRTDETGFPPLHQFHPLMAVKITHFNMVLPVAEVLERPE
jgi:hypothetical protein